MADRATWRGELVFHMSAMVIPIGGVLGNEISGVSGGAMGAILGIAAFTGLIACFDRMGWFGG